MKTCEYCGHIMHGRQELCTVCGNATSRHICACCEKELPDGRSNYCAACKMDRNHLAKAAVVIARRSSNDFSVLSVRTKENAENKIRETSSNIAKKTMDILLSEDFYQDVVNHPCFKTRACKQEMTCKLWLTSLST